MKDGQDWEASRPALEQIGESRGCLVEMGRPGGYAERLEDLWEVLSGREGSMG